MTRYNTRKTRPRVKKERVGDRTSSICRQSRVKSGAIVKQQQSRPPQFHHGHTTPIGNQVPHPPEGPIIHTQGPYSNTSPKRWAEKRSWRLKL